MSQMEQKEHRIKQKNRITGKPSKVNLNKYMIIIVYFLSRDVSEDLSARDHV